MRQGEPDGEVAVALLALLALAGRRHARHAADHLHYPQVGEVRLIPGQRDHVVFERGLQRRHVEAIPLLRELDRPDQARVLFGLAEAELPAHVLRDRPAHAGGVEGGADQAVANLLEDHAHDLLLLVARHAAHLDRERFTPLQVPFNGQQHAHRKVGHPGEVEAEGVAGGEIQRRQRRLQLGHEGREQDLLVEPRAVQEVGRQLQAQHGRLGGHARLDQGRGQPGARAEGRDAEQLLVGAVAVEVDDVLPPGGFGLCRPFLAGDQADALVEPVAQRLVEVDPDMREFRATGENVLDGGVEDVLGPVMGRADHHLAAPHQEGEGRLQQLREAVHEGRFVDDHHALLAAQRARGGREGDDLEARGEADAEGLDRAVALRIAVGEQEVLGGIRRDGESARPHRAGVDELARHLLAIGDVHGVHAAGGLLPTGAQDGVGGESPGQADAAGFLDDQNGRGNRGAVEQRDHLRLVGQQHCGEADLVDHVRQRLGRGEPLALPFLAGDRGGHARASSWPSTMPKPFHSASAASAAAQSGAGTKSP